MNNNNNNKKTNQLPKVLLTQTAKECNIPNPSLDSSWVPSVPQAESPWDAHAKASDILGASRTTAALDGDTDIG